MIRRILVINIIINYNYNNIYNYNSSYHLSLQKYIFLFSLSSYPVKKKVFLSLFANQKLKQKLKMRRSAGEALHIFINIYYFIIILFFLQYFFLILRDWLVDVNYSIIIIYIFIYKGSRFQVPPLIYLIYILKKKK